MIEIQVGNISLQQHSKKTRTTTTLSTENGIPILVLDKRPKSATMGNENGQRWNIISIK